jgi:aspartate racemase
MKTFGLIGGTSWQSTIEYYSRINKAINERYGDNTNPPLRIINLNQKQIHDLQRNDDWDAIAEIFIDAARELESIGVQGLAICATTPQKTFDQLHNSVLVPIVHMADAIGSTLAQQIIGSAGQLGTRFTMTEDFIKQRLLTKYSIRTIVPDSTIQDEIQNRFYTELSVGEFNDETRQYFQKTIESLADRGAQAVILGCTEFPILLRNTKCCTPLFDSLDSHCSAIVKYILSEVNLVKKSGQSDSLPA